MALRWTAAGMMEATGFPPAQGPQATPNPAVRPGSPPSQAGDQPTLEQQPRPHSLLIPVMPADNFQQSAGHPTLAVGRKAPSAVTYPGHMLSKSATGRAISRLADHVRNASIPLSFLLITLPFPLFEDAPIASLGLILTIIAEQLRHGCGLLLQ